MNNEIIIEKLKKEDEPKTADFINNVLQHEFSSSLHHLAADDVDNLYATYSGKRDLFLTLKKDENIIGTVGIKEDSRKVALLRRLFIAPEYRNQGFGKTLVEKCIDFCEKNNYEMICFRGNNQMDNAIKVIEKLGFLRKDILDFGKFHIYIYVKLL